jgi:predicted nucleic acid-binding protein
MLFHEPGGDVVAARLVESDRVISSRLLRVEAERAVLRFGLDRPDQHRLQASLERDLKMFWPNVDFIEMTREICELAGRCAPRSHLRSLDAIHLATYYRVKELDPSTRIFTFDTRIIDEVDRDAVFPPDRRKPRRA